MKIGPGVASTDNETARELTMARRRRMGAGWSTNLHKEYLAHPTAPCAGR